MKRKIETRGGTRVGAGRPLEGLTMVDISEPPNWTFPPDDEDHIGDECPFCHCWREELEDSDICHNCRDCGATITHNGEWAVVPIDHALAFLDVQQALDACRNKAGVK